MIKESGDLIAAAKTKIKSVDAKQAKELYDQADNAIIIDVRENDTALKSKLHASVNIPRGILEMQIQNTCTDPDALILIHCAGGGRACLSTLTLQEMGYKNVYAITAKYEDIKSLFD